MLLRVEMLIASRSYLRRLVKTVCPSGACSTDSSANTSFPPRCADTQTRATRAGAPACGSTNHSTARLSRTQIPPAACPAYQDSLSHLACAVRSPPPLGYA